jgi:hypothetical protein
MVTVNWMIDQIPDAETDLGLGILEHILIGTPASPLRNNSGLGEDIAGRGLDDELLQPMLSVGLKGIDPSGAEKVEALVLETLRALASKRSNFACARTISAHFRVASRQSCTRSRLGSTTATRRRRWRSRRRFSERAESDETELARSIIGTIGDIDAYQLPDGERLHLDAAVPRWRDRRGPPAQARPDSRRSRQRLSSLCRRPDRSDRPWGSEHAVRAANTRRPGFLHVSRVM